MPSESFAPSRTSDQTATGSCPWNVRMQSRHFLKPFLIFLVYSFFGSHTHTCVCVAAYDNCRLCCVLATSACSGTWHALRFRLFVIVALIYIYIFYFCFHFYFCSLHRSLTLSMSLLPFLYIFLIAICFCWSVSFTLLFKCFILLHFLLIPVFCWCFLFPSFFGIFMMFTLWRHIAKCVCVCVWVWCPNVVVGRWSKISCLPDLINILSMGIAHVSAALCELNVDFVWFIYWSEWCQWYRHIKQLLHI